MPSGRKDMTEIIKVEGVDMVNLLGPGDRLLTTLQQEYPDVDIHVRGNTMTLSPATPETDTSHLVQARALVIELLTMVQNGQELAPADVVASRLIMDTHPHTSPSAVLGEAILTSRGKTIRAKTIGQQQYVQAIDENTIVFGIGPAGTGKTYLAMAKAVQALQRKEVERIILTRPAVEAGERLGFLPGSLTDKIDPYLRPLFDALGEMLDPELVPKLLATGTIEVAPLAYMRGRTLNNSFIVLDEAQNTTPEQMKMFLTRLGFGSKMVITGDITQIDLPSASSGLRLVTQVLAEIEDIHFARLGSEDVVRHNLVGKIVDAYTAYEEQAAAKRAERDEAREFAQRLERRASGASRTPTDRFPPRGR